MHRKNKKTLLILITVLLLAGISAGANVAAAIMLAERQENAKHFVVNAPIKHFRDKVCAYPLQAVRAASSLR